ncbi:MAG: glutaminase [Euzebya sp.]
MTTELSDTVATVAQEVHPLVGTGAVATYIPALARVPADSFALAVAPLQGEVCTAGLAQQGFSIQSISKVFTLTLAMQRFAGDLWRRVGREPSGDPFNSLVQLEYENGKPRNPFINAGAIVVADVLRGCLADPLGELVTLISELAGSPVTVDGEVALSEAETGFRNRSLANLMKGFGNIDHDPDDVLDVYFAQCSVAMTATQLATALRFLANDGVDPTSGARVLSVSKARRVNALMLTCGTYDAAGEFAFRVGIPCKSGVGGGVVGVVPHHLAACAWSPGLDPTGNSVAGRAAMEALVDHTGLSVF